jgi:hypothetical protein
MNTAERIKMVKAMEFIARQVNDEIVFNRWLLAGVPDGDIEYGDLSIGPDDPDNMEYLIEDETFADLMAVFLRVMSGAKKSGGLYCDGILDKEAN